MKDVLDDGIIIMFIMGFLVLSNFVSEGLIMG